MLDPQSMAQQSIMPSYEWMLDDNIDTASTAAKIRAMITLGVPYEKGYDKVANIDLMKQATEIANNLKKDKIETLPDKEIVAIIAYLQRLGKDIKATPTSQTGTK